MPNYFALTPKGETERASLQEVDDLLCAAFGVQPDPELWFRNWYNTIGLGFALGHSPARIREIWAEDAPRTEVLDWILARYDVEAWYEGR